MFKFNKVSFAVLMSACVGFSSVAVANDYKVIEGVIYGQGDVTLNGEVQPRDLWMDVYLPENVQAEPTEAIFMTFGGAYHRGHPHNPYLMEGAQTTSMKEYCETFVKRGHACFTIDYRVAPEQPVPTREGYSEDMLNMDAVPNMQGQVNIVRSLMELPALDFNKQADVEILENTVLSAAEDLRSAVRFVKDNASEYNIDPDKIVLGGFSAGAITSLNVGHGMQEPVAGVMMLGTAEIGFDIKKTVKDGEEVSPILMFQGQYDLPATFIGTPDLLEHYNNVGVDYSYSWIPGASHFYPAGSVALSGDGLRKPIEQRMVEFIERVTQ
ncbi:alpha/beta hydrolase fold domain-containing protein [Vibrio sp. SCSIO 43132]|uniref:alpha/beta hydrolase n=1 Tax=Vibrio sp. SCSIO 43132 TaxID=2779363 RepID=UPI001CA80225|nr:alpha/beta hydrolase fold domain-containing protein [Vibrio sp. SCSIO 43132]UAB73493.1 alpha/beta hydrolase fold domain-containing protein [Vibrio sp. SCSIO 43132]